jgi:uncharacterized protein (TIGR02246 family)
METRRRHGIFHRAKCPAYLLALLLVNPVTTLANLTATNANRQDGVKRNDELRAAARIAEIVAIAWNQNDSETLAGLFLPHAVLIMPTGSVAHSRTAIKQRIIDERNGKLKNTTLQNTIAGVAVTGSQAAIVKGNYQLDGMRILGFETSSTGPFIFHQRKQQGRWMILKAEILR